MLECLAVLAALLNLRDFVQEIMVFVYLCCGLSCGWLWVLNLQRALEFPLKQAKRGCIILCLFPAALFGIKCYELQDVLTQRVGDTMTWSSGSLLVLLSDTQRAELAP